jgi:hypothetical protein
MLLSRRRGLASAVAAASTSHRRRPNCKTRQTRSAVRKHLHGYHGSSRQASSHSRSRGLRAPTRGPGTASLAARPRPVYCAAAWKTLLQRSSGWPPDRIAQTVSCTLMSRGTISNLLLWTSLDASPFGDMDRRPLRNPPGSAHSTHHL